jgi:glycerol dehydrogenase-like iron-containing ADH family enzyme
VVYVLGTGVPLTAGKLVANQNKLPLVIVPTSISSDEIFEPHVTLPAQGLLHRSETGPANEVIIDWSVIEAAPIYERASGIVDVLAIVTALLDWRYAAKLNRNTPEQQFSQWGAGVAAGLATQAIKSAREIGEGKIEALRTLVDLLMMSVQLANQLGHDRHEEGTEHYLAFSLGNQGAHFNHAEAVGPGILLPLRCMDKTPLPCGMHYKAAGHASTNYERGTSVSPLMTYRISVPRTFCRSALPMKLTPSPNKSPKRWRRQAWLNPFQWHGRLLFQRLWNPHPPATPPP